MIKLYYHKDLYDSSTRTHLFPLLKPLLKKEGFTDDERKKMYFISNKDLVIVDEIGDADWIVLPMSWNYYSENKQTKKVIQFVKEVQQLKKTVLSFTNGDFGVNIPKIKNLIVYRLSGDRSKLPSNHIGLPSFINDPLLNYFQEQSISFNAYSEKPKIGFCGQTNASFINALKEINRTVIRNIKYFFSLSNNQPQKIQSTSSLRNRVLVAIKRSDKIEAKFIERKKYRAGAITLHQKQKSSIEFYDNIYNTDYTVCVRGAGNFSVRLYETLAMGRIPVFINTDCILPLANKIDWKKHLVWVEDHELDQLEEIIIKFHNKYTPEEFKRLQDFNRKLWEEKLTLGGFFKTELND
jgi:hypothetical protein